MPSEVLTYQSNIDQVTAALLETRDAAETADAALGIAENALTALDEIDRNATALENIASGLETALQLVSRLGGPFGTVTNALKRAIDIVEDRAGEVRAAAEAAKPVESRFENIINALEIGQLTLQAEVLLIDEQVQQLGSITDGLADAVNVVENTNGMDIPVEFTNTIAAANATVASINLGYQPIIDALDTVENVRTSIASVIEPVVAPGRAISDALYAITQTVSGLNFLSGPLGVLQDILSPIKWALDAIQVIYDATIGLVVDPIIDALGVADIFNDFLSTLGLDLDALTVDVLPDIDIFEDFTNPLNALFDQLDIGLIDNLTAALENLSDQIIGTDLLGPVNNTPDNTSALVIGDDDNPPSDETGTALDALAGDDLVSGGLGDDTLIGGAGNDLLIGGAGDDIIDGGTGFDGAVFFGLFQEFRFSYDVDDNLVVTHIGFDGGGWQGTDRVTNVDKVIFSDRTFDFDDFRDFRSSNSTPTQSDTLEGDGFEDGLNVPTPDFLLGGNGRDFIYGYEENDYIAGGGGEDDLFGGNGDDILDGSDIGNTYFGGAGNDTVTYDGLDGNPNGANTVYVAMLTDASRIPFNASDEEYNEIENITGAPGLDTWLWGDGNDNVLTGGDQDRINGFEGNDTILGGLGYNELVGGQGDDYIDSGLGQSFIFAGPGNDTYVAPEGGRFTTVWYGGVTQLSLINRYDWSAVQPSEVAEGASGPSRLPLLGFVEGDVPTLIPSRIVADLNTGIVEKYNASDNPMGIDTLIGITSLDGSEGDDEITTASSGDIGVVAAGGGDDDIYGAEQLDYINEGPSLETLNALILGDAGDDRFYPEFGGFLFAGGSGRDRVYITTEGYVSFNGGRDADTLILSGSDRAWDMRVVDQSVQLQGFNPGDTPDPVTGDYADASYVSIFDVEEIIGSNFDDILRTGDGTLFNFVVTNILGRGGNDQLFSGSFNGSVNGEDHILIGGTGDDLLYGNNGNDEMHGGDGNDRFWEFAPGQSGSTGLDSYQGGDGNDRFYFSEDIFNFRSVRGEGGFDTIDFTGYDVGLTLSLTSPRSFERYATVEQVRGTRFGDDIEGDEETNFLIGLAGNDTLVGLGGDDVIYTGFGEDVVRGGAGNDLIFAALSNDDIDGGSGTDMLSFDAYQTGEDRQSTPGWTPEETLGSAVVVLEDDYVSFVGQSGGLSLHDVTNVENITGGWLNDTLRGDARDNVISGGSFDGEDLIEGRAGADILSGGDGDDTIYGDGPEPMALPQLSNTDAVSFNGGVETRQAAVLDVYDMPTDAVTVELLFRANEANLPASFMTFFSYAAGSPVDQEEFLIFGYTTILSQTLGIRINGNNYLSNVPTSTILEGDIHRLSASYDGATGAVALYLDGDEIVSGTTNAGGLGENGRVLIAQDQDADGVFRGVKSMRGEVADLRVWNEVRSEAEIDALAFQDALDPLANPALVTNWVPDADQPGIIEDVVAGANLQLVREPEFASFAISDDVLDGGAGADMLSGGEGTDLATYAGSDARVEIDLLAGTANGGHATGDTLISIEDITGSAFNDLILGDGEANTFDGGEGNDTIEGGAGNDTIEGGANNDVLRGDAGADNLKGEDGNDVLSGGADNDVLNGGADNDVLFGGSENDLLFGGSGVDRLFGGAGFDRLFGGSENDIANGGGDNDIINTGSGNDLVFAQGGNDLVFLQAGNDKAFGGTGNDKVFGGIGNDEINLGDGNDEAFGGAGVDLITGAGGNDIMSGGGDADRFVFAADQGADRITDFSGGDTIDISAFGVTDGGASDQDWRDATFSVVTSGGGANVTIAWDGGGTLVLEAIGIASLTDSDFVF